LPFLPLLDSLMLFLRENNLKMPQSFLAKSEEKD